MGLLFCLPECNKAMELDVQRIHIAQLHGPWHSCLLVHSTDVLQVYPIVAQMWNDGNLTAEGIEIAKYYGIRNDTDTPMYTGSPGIQDCFNDYCVRFESEDEWCKSPNGTYDIGENWWQLVCDSLPP